MYLFFDGVSTQGYLALFNEERKIVAENKFTIAGNESTKTISLIDEFLSTQQTTYRDIKNIVVVVGPGSFTGIRTISLVVNTLAYTYPNIHLTPIVFFELYDHYPIIKASSKRDLFVKYEKSATIMVQKNDDFLSLFSGDTVYGDISNVDICDKYKVVQNIDYKNFIGSVVLENYKSVAPVYIKKPNIS